MRQKVRRGLRYTARPARLPYVQWSPRRSLRSARRRREVRPPMGRISGGVPVRGWLRSPAVIESATPMGSTASQPTHRRPACGKPPPHEIITRIPPRQQTAHSTSGLEEVDLLVTAGEAKRNPRYGPTPRRQPRRGAYAISRHGHSDLFEADITISHPTSGSAALHPRLLIARPLRGRQPLGLLPSVSRPGWPLRMKILRLFPPLSTHLHYLCPY